MNKKVDILVIGKGVAGTILLETIFNSQIPCGNIAWIGVNQSDLTCSLNSTALVAKQGVQKGMSPLGDILYEAYDLTKDYFEKYQSVGVEKAERYHFFSNDVEKDKLMKRFGEGLVDTPFDRNGFCESVYLVGPQVFLKSLQDKLHARVYTYENYLVSELHFRDEWWHVETNGGKKYLAKKVIDATGAYGQLLRPHHRRPVAKTVSGHYLEWHNVEFDKSFVVTLDGHNLIYRKSDKTLLLSGTAVKDGTMVPRSEIYNIKAFVEQNFPELMPQEESVLKVGLREKGKKRMPYYSEVEKNLFCVGGLYKNGFTFSHYLARELLEQLRKS